MCAPRSIVIVGAGFSGAMVAANLLKSQHLAPTRVVLIERSSSVARGKAYADREHPYLLNVPAGRMSVNPDSPLEFLSFARHRLPEATAEDFLPRTLYGEYLEATLLGAELSARPHVRLDRIRGDACAVETAAQELRGHAEGLASYLCGARAKFKTPRGFAAWREPRGQLREAHDQGA